MTDELHNHIAGMVCETDAPGKPADVTAALEGVTALVAEYRARVEVFDGLTAIMGELRTDRGKRMHGLHKMTADKLEALAAALAEQTANLADLQVSHGILLRLNAAEITAGAHEHRRAEAAEARVAELTAKLDAARVALKPFADAADDWPDDWPEDANNMEATGIELRKGYFVKARAALAKIKGGAE